ncbi:hypothetical protein Dhaf_0718 [Desulfitobacterium hafniense DCB-2]|uniref:Uncharacterized protein n=1 Tax=Desulfitobacterium hafniense (strain DSM 10664 / DCB-2) TaxID=272564 RepID=B8FVZ6_DESHD|nr:hypothetical protein Dhaf_0718 [Desulfitobacterium hafniense DCB-2]
MKAELSTILPGVAYVLTLILIGLVIFENWTLAIS